MLLCATMLLAQNPLLLNQQHATHGKSKYHQVRNMYIQRCRQHFCSRPVHLSAVHMTHRVSRDQSTQHCVTCLTARHRCKPAVRPCVGSAAGTAPCSKQTFFIRDFFHTVCCTVRMSYPAINQMFSCQNVYKVLFFFLYKLSNTMKHA